MPSHTEQEQIKKLQQDTTLGTFGNVGRTPAGFVKLDTGETITGADLTLEPSLNWNKPEPTPVPDIKNIDTTPQTATQATSEETNISDLIKRITETQSSILGESAFTAEQQKAQGISDLTSKQNDLVAQIQSFQTQSAALENQKRLAEERIMQESEGRGRTAGGVSPLIASAQRKITLQQADIASQALIAQANLYGTQGKLATANMLVEQAVSAKFGAKKEQLKAQIANLEIMLKDPKLDKAIKDRAAAQLLIKQKQDAELKKQTDNFEEAQKETLKYSGIADSVTLAKMSKAKTALEVAQIAQAGGLKTLEQQKAEKELTKPETGDIGEYQNAIRLGFISKGTSFLEYVRQKGAAGRKGEGTGIFGKISGVTQSIIDNPTLFDDLTPTLRGVVIGELQANGYDTSNLGVKGLSDTAIKEIGQSQKALADLNELKTLVQGKENLLGPITGLQRFNPYSKARQLQADVDRVRQTVGKALEGGVLRKEDEDKYKKILATLADTPATAIYKIDALLSSIQRDIENYKSLQQSSGKSLNVKTPLGKKGKILTPEELRTKWRY